MINEKMAAAKIGLIIGVLGLAVLAAGCAAGTGEEEGLTPGQVETATPAGAGRALSPAASATPSPPPASAVPSATVEPDGSVEPAGGPAGSDGSGSPFGGELVEREAMVEEIGVALLESFPVQVTVTVRGYLPDGCTTIGRSEQFVDGYTISVTLYTVRPAEAMCTQALVPYEETIALNVLGLPAGDYTVDVNGVQDGFSLPVDN